jgi:hypothetical protein
VDRDGDAMLIHVQPELALRENIDRRTCFRHGRYFCTGYRRSKKFFGVREAPWNGKSSQLGGETPIFSVFRFPYRVSTGDYSEIIGPGWHLSSPGRETKHVGFHRC